MALFFSGGGKGLLIAASRFGISAVLGDAFDRSGAGGGVRFLGLAAGMLSWGRDGGREVLGEEPLPVPLVEAAQAAEDLAADRRERRRASWDWDSLNLLSETSSCTIFDR